MIFQHIEHQRRESIFHHFLHYKFFYKIFIKFKSTFDAFTSQYLRYDDSLFLL